MRSNLNYNTFGERIISFFDTLQKPEKLPPDIEIVYPYGEHDVKQAINDFYNTFYKDRKKRVFVLGINPGRFGSGMTGIPFTDPVALEKQCGISNSFDKKRELSSEFVYKFIDVYGGPKKFYADFFLSAVSPLGFVRNGKNYNYYDDPNLYKKLQPFIIQTLNEQVSLGAKPTAILFGSGKNQKFFTNLNNKHHFFDTILTLEHPRYIMQYKRKHVDMYIKIPLGFTQSKITYCIPYCCISRLYQFLYPFRIINWSQNICVRLCRLCRNISLLCRI